MFRREKRPATPILRLYDSAGQCLFDAPLERLTLPEPLVLSLSDAFFGDPDPCYIHRGAVMQRVFMALTNALEGKGAVPVPDLPEETARYLAAYPQCAACRLVKEEQP